MFCLFTCSTHIQGGLQTHTPWTWHSTTNPTQPDSLLSLPQYPIHWLRIARVCGQIDAFDFVQRPLPHRAREGRHASIPDLMPVHVKTNQLSQGPAGARRSERRETDVRDLVIAQEELLAGSQGPTLKRSGESRTSRAASTRGETHEACRTMPPRFDAIQADGRVGQHGEGSKSGGRTSTRLLFCPIFGLSGTLKD